MGIGYRPERCPPTQRHGSMSCVRVGVVKKKINVKSDYSVRTEVRKVWREVSKCTKGRRGPSWAGWAAHVGQPQ